MRWPGPGRQTVWALAVRRHLEGTPKEGEVSREGLASGSVSGEVQACLGMPKCSASAFVAWSSGGGHAQHSRTPWLTAQLMLEAGHMCMSKQPCWCITTRTGGHRIS